MPSERLGRATFHRILYGPYRLKHPIVRRGWKRWADDGFPQLTQELKAKYKFDSRGTDTFECRVRYQAWCDGYPSRPDDIVFDERQLKPHDQLVPS